MESVVLRAIWLTVLIGGMLPCIASEITEPTMTTNPDFTVTIPKGGLPQDVEEVFFLQPSQILRVIDETGKAVYMPQAITDSVDASQGSRTDADVASSESYSAAYAFVNGKCDFTTEIQYKEAFPDYTAPLWVRTVYTVPKTEAAPSETAANFTLTNPPAEYLNESVSFCVRFKTLLASGSTSSTTTTTGATPTSETGVGTPSSKPSKPTVPPEGSSHSGGSSHPQVEFPNDNPNVGGDDNHSDDQGEGHVTEPVTPSPGNKPSTGQEQGIDVMAPPEGQNHAEDNTSENGNSKGDAEVTDQDTLNKDGVEGDKTVKENRNPQARRLSGTGSPKEAYVTIVLHSAAWGLAGGVEIISVYMVSITAALSFIF
ncbi:Toxoplasma gondii family A protein [Toxoplasma gondii RUB]|uniref:Toxoplasma gondii family A protein n=1 Tax=Toxoplasma gondii RUB TaxID=935652 RepID=A0A086LPN8_TOXGO|nr:Toxoplasma gondii family A protein [Toxoplasma gondii RUB]